MTNLAHLIEKLTASSPNEEIVVHRTGSHSGYLTYDGVDVNGKRIRDEIVAKKDSLKSEKGSVTKFSLIGYSMGGLVCRYALGILYHEGFFDEIHPVNFVTFCTPHVGIINPNSSFLARMFNTIGPLTISHTGQQFFLKDKKLAHHVPLLQWMADPASKFYKALELFDSRSLYANTINDRRTSWYTTSISTVDPFNSMVNESLSAYELKYIEGYSPTIIDFSQPITFNKVEATELGLTFRTLLLSIFTWLHVLGQFLLITPIYSIFLLTNAIWQRIKVSRRLYLFYRDGAESLYVLYEMVNEEVTVASGEEEEEDDEALVSGSDSESFMEAFSERIRDQTDIFIESILNAVDSKSYFDYHYSITNSKGANHMLADESKTFLDKKTLINLKGKEVNTDFKLNLTGPQLNIVANLNLLNWNKYPVIIRNTKATHAAVIHRQNDPTFDEGKVVLRHFTELVLKV